MTSPSLVITAETLGSIVPSDVEERYSSIVFEAGITLAQATLFMINQQIFLPMGMILPIEKSELERTQFPVMVDFFITPEATLTFTHNSRYNEIEDDFKVSHHHSVGCLDLRRERVHLELDTATILQSVINSNAFISGSFSASLETNILQFLKLDESKCCIAVSNGTDALELIFRAVSEKSTVPLAQQVVLVPSFTYIATASSVKLAGLRVEYIDLPTTDLSRYVISAQQVKQVMHGNVIAVVGVSLFGQVPDFSAIRAVLPPGVVLIEDAAQSFGSAASMTHPAVHISCTSFYPAKILGAYGDAGAIICDVSMNATIRSLANHGTANGEPYIHSRLGRNSRMDGFQAAILSAKLSKFYLLAGARNHVADFYDNAFSAIADNIIVPDRRMNEIFSQYTLYTERRDALVAHLQAAGIDARVFYKVPCHLQKATENTAIALPHTDHAAQHVLSIPAFPFMSFSEMHAVATSVKQFFL